jgi:hypothetical protein
LSELIDEVNRLSGSPRGKRRNSAPRGLTLGRAARFGRKAARLNPWVRTALDVSSLLAPAREEEWTNLGDWSLYATCATPSPLYNGGMAKGAQSSLESSGTIKNFTESCLAGQGLLSPIGEPFYDVDNRKSVAVGRTAEISTTYRVQLQYAFTRPNYGAEDDPPRFRPAVAPHILPVSSPLTWVITAFPDEFPPFTAPAFSAPVKWADVPYWHDVNREVYNGVQNLPFNTVRNSWALNVVATSVGGYGGRTPPRYHYMGTPNPRRS